MAVAEPNRNVEAERGRGWSWAALAAGVLLWVGGLPTFGASVLLSPFSLALSAIAWRRSRNDEVFWIGLALNAILGVGLLSFVIGVFTGDVGIELE